jgi:hypothetical protein
VQPGQVIGEAWRLYRRHWPLLIPIAFIVYALLQVFTLVIALLAGPTVGIIVGFFVSIVGTYWIQGALVEAVADIRDGRADLTIGQTLERVSQRINVLSAAAILAALGIGIGFVLLIVPGLVLMTIWSLIVPAIVLEKRGVFESFGRSRELVRGHGWSVFGVILLTFLISLAASLVIGLALSWLPNAAASFLSSILSATLTAPFIALAWTLMYYRLRDDGGRTT